MEINQLLQNFINKECSCGKSHQITLPNIIVKSGAIKELPKLLLSQNVRKVYLLTDETIYEIVGKNICETLKFAGIESNIHIFREKPLEPNEYAVGSSIMYYTNDCDAVIAVGSGVLNDLGKIVATIAKKTYIVVATSFMDGYSSTLSAVIRDGLKYSLPTKYADIIIGDIDVLKNTPKRMMLAGIGDMLAKYISVTDWRISHEITGEYYCERVAGLVRETLKRCVDNAEGLLSREENAVKEVFESIIVGGLTMKMSGVSRPVSGTEHNFSHFMDMRKLEFGTKTDLHGIQVAIGTLYSAKLFHKCLSIVPNKEKAERYVNSFSFEAWSKELYAFLGNSAKQMVALESKEHKYDLEKHKKRLSVLLQKWDKICEIIKEEVPSVNALENLLDRLNIPKTVEELGIDCDMFMAFKATKDIREKYLLSMMLWDLGELDDIK